MNAYRTAISAVANLRGGVLGVCFVGLAWVDGVHQAQWDIATDGLIDGPQGSIERGS